MSERGLPPYPLTNDWKSWATQIVEFLISEARSEEFVAPRVISLLHQIPPDIYRPLDDGLVMFDPSLGVPVFSEGGQWRQFTKSGDLNYLVTDDAGDGTVADDINNTDFTGQQGAVGTCAECPVGTNVAFYHKGIQYLYTGPTPASYGLGCADTMDIGFLIPVGVGTFLGLTDTPDDYSGQANKWPRVNTDEDALVFDDIQEVDIIDLDRLRWRGNWVDGNSYAKNDVVLDWPYLAAANKATTDRPAPIDVGNPFFIYNGAAPTASLTAKTLLVGNTYTIPVALKVPTVRVYTVTGNFYSVYLKDVATGQITTLRSFEATITDWVEIAGPGNVLAAGTQFEVALYVTEPDPSPTTFSGNWNYTTPNNATPPTTGQITQADRLLSSFRVHKTDNDGGDRSADLATMTVGDTIEGGGIRWSISAITDNGTWVDFEVAPQQQITDGIQSFTFETVTATPITVVADTDFYLGNADVRPFYSIDSGPRVLTDDAYNVDIEVQEIDLSDDWDLMAQSGGGGTGGSGGASKFTELSDTPINYTGLPQRMVTVNPTEDALIFGNDVVGDMTLVGKFTQRRTAFVMVEILRGADAANPDGKFQFTINADGSQHAIRLNEYGSNDFSFEEGQRDENGNALPNPTSVVNRRAGDARYKLATAASSATVGDTFPGSPNEGDLHYLTAEPVGLYIYYNDGDSTQWVQTNGGLGEQADPTPVDQFADYEWVDESANRSLATDYLNDTGQTIKFAVSRISSVNGVLRQASVEPKVDGIAIGNQSYIDRNSANGWVMTGEISVPPGSTYRCDSSVGSTTIWVEFKKKVV